MGESVYMLLIQPRTFLVNPTKMGVWAPVDHVSVGLWDGVK